MEDNSGVNIVNVESRPEIVIPKVRKCSCCGKVKPLDEFPRKGPGYEKICKSCKLGEGETSDKFKDYTSRELIEELRHRGYRGTLKLIIEKEVAI